MILDTLDDVLCQLFWSQDNWAAWVGEDIARTIAAAMPPMPWQILIAVVQIGLGGYLIAGSLRLRRRKASNVEICRTWAKATVLWVLVSMGLALWWVARIGGDLPGVSQAQVESAATWGVALAAIFLLAYPLFMLYWLSRDAIQAETAAWSQ